MNTTLHCPNSCKPYVCLFVVFCFTAYQFYEETYLKLCCQLQQTTRLMSIFFRQSIESIAGKMPLPSWLLKPGPVSLRHFLRSSKNDTLVQEVELLGGNPIYTHTNTTVSFRDLANCPLQTH